MEPIRKSGWIHIKDRKMLHARTRGKDIYFTPGGKREVHESDEEALVREIKEELGVDLIPETVIYLATFSAQAAGKPEGMMVEVKCFGGDYHGTLTPSGEIEELAWFTSNDADKGSATGQLILQWLKEQDRID